MIRLFSHSQRIVKAVIYRIFPNYSRGCYSSDTPISIRTPPTCLSLYGGAGCAKPDAAASIALLTIFVTFSSIFYRESSFCRRIDLSPKEKQEVGLRVRARRNAATRKASISPKPQPNRPANVSERQPNIRIVVGTGRLPVVVEAEKVVSRR